MTNCACAYSYHKTLSRPSHSSRGSRRENRCKERNKLYIVCRGNCEETINMQLTQTMKTRPTTLSLLLLFSLITSQARKECVYNSEGTNVYSEKKMKFYDATGWAFEKCEGRLPDVCGIQRDDTWLGIKRETTHWKWINGTSVSTPIFHKKKRHRKRHNDHHGCALFHSGESYIKAFHCHTAGIAALCKRNGDGPCIFESHWCALIAGHCYCVVEALNWYHARKACVDIGAYLAILPERSHRKHIAEALADRPPNIMTTNFLWIGLHREDWKKMCGPRAGNSIVCNNFASINVYDPPRGNCAVVKNKTWHVVSCHERHHAVSICNEMGKDKHQRSTSVWPNNPATTGDPPSRRPPSSGSQHRACHIAVMILLLAFIHEIKAM